MSMGSVVYTKEIFSDKVTFSMLFKKSEFVMPHALFSEPVRIAIFDWIKNTARMFNLKFEEIVIK